MEYSLKIKKAKDLNVNTEFEHNDRSVGYSHICWHGHVLRRGWACLEVECQQKKKKSKEAKRSKKKPKEVKKDIQVAA